MKVTNNIFTMLFPDQGSIKLVTLLQALQDIFSLSHEQEMEAIYSPVYLYRVTQRPTLRLCCHSKTERASAMELCTLNTVYSKLANPY